MANDMQIDPELVIRALGQQVAEQAIENAKQSAVIAGLLEQRNATVRAADAEAKQ